MYPIKVLITKTQEIRWIYKESELPRGLAFRVVYTTPPPQRRRGETSNSGGFQRTTTEVIC